MKNCACFYTWRRDGNHSRLAFPLCRDRKFGFVNRMLLALLVLFVPCSLFSQIRFHLGVVKGKHVTYRCALHTSKSSNIKHVNGVPVMGEEVESAHPNMWAVWNMHNPDTVTKFKNEVMDAMDVQCQVAKILRKHLSAEELWKLDKSDDNVFIYMRIGDNKNKLSQVTRFLFWRYHPYEGEDMSVYNGFWLNLSPDRLHELEKAILEEVVMPDSYYEFYGTSYDFAIMLTDSDICNSERINECENGGKEWKKIDEVCK